MLIFRLGLLYLVALLFFAWGIAAAEYKVFPWPLIQTVKNEIDAFVKGDVNEDSTLGQKLRNDLGLSPERQIRDFAPEDPDRFRAVPTTGLRSRRDHLRVWMASNAPQNYRVIAGAFDFEEAFWGAILMDPSGEIVHRWAMSGEYAELTDKPDVMKNLYGLAFFPDGSAAYSLQERAKGLIKIDICSRVEWIKKGDFHHVVSPTEDGTAFWTFGGDQADLHPKLVLIDTATGETIKQIDMADVEKQNPDFYIFDLQRHQNTVHATHPNDIEPLPAGLAQAFPDFSPGDLVISYRTTNLVFVLDPATLNIKWWYVGAGDTPHDPDWQADGTISLFNNNQRAEWRRSPLFSTIVSIDPAANSHQTLVDGKALGLYSSFNGHHQITDNSTVMITSSTQGRVTEVDIETGEAVFDFINSYSWDESRALHVSETFSIDAEVAQRWASSDCTGDAPANGD